MRLPYAPSTPPADSPAETASIYARIAARRHPRPLIPLDRALLHSPPVADGWNSLLGAIRSQTVLDQGLLELAVCRVAVLNRAVYEWNAHAPLALKGGVRPEGLCCARDVGAYGGEGGGGCCQWGAEDRGLSAGEWAVLAYTDQMTHNVKVDDEVFEALRTVAGLGEREVVELTTGIASYNCVSRVLVALDVGEWNGTEMKSVDEMVGDVQVAQREKQNA